MLRSMDEILAAEVLVVKRTLGPEHESALVRSLEKARRGPVKRRQLLALLVFVSLLVLWILIEIGT